MTVQIIFTTLAVMLLSAAIWHFTVRRYLYQERLRPLLPLFRANSSRVKNLLEVRSLLQALKVATTSPGRPIFHPVTLVSSNGTIRKLALARHPEMPNQGEGLEQIPDLYSRRVLHAALSGTLVSARTHSDSQALANAARDRKSDTDREGDS